MNNGDSLRATRGTHGAWVGSCFIGVRQAETWSYKTSTGVYRLREPHGDVRASSLDLVVIETRYKPTTVNGTLGP